MDTDKSLYWSVIRTFIFCLIFIISSCSSKGSSDSAVPRTGYGIPAQDPSQYYYQAPRPQYIQQPVQYQQQYYYQAPQPYVVPGSRFYSNPYAIPPSSRYQRYDTDQYYVPPTYYNNVEPQRQNTNALSATHAGVSGKQ